jgi:hypothetical protein
MNISKKNIEGYLDLTAYEAMSSIRREEIRAERPPYPRVYICSPYAGDVKRNTENAIRYCRFALEQGRFPIAPHLFLPRFMNDADREERELALSFGLRFLGGCREIWIFGDTFSAGMKREIAEARRRGITMKFFTADCEVRCSE